MRQGRLNVATWVIVNGRLGSGFCSPALICACAVADTRVAAPMQRLLCVSPPPNVSRPTKVSHMFDPGSLHPDHDSAYGR